MDIEMVSQEMALAQDKLPAEKRRFGMIRVTKTWNTRTRSTCPTKGGYWRSVPISGELYWLLAGLKAQTGKESQVLPRFWQWYKGEQARVLRDELRRKARPQRVDVDGFKASAQTEIKTNGAIPPN